MIYSFNRNSAALKKYEVKLRVLRYTEVNKNWRIRYISIFKEKKIYECGSILEYACKFSQCSNPWGPYVGDVHDVLSPLALLSSYQLVPMASFMESTHLMFDLPLFLLPPTFPTLSSFPKNLAFSRRVQSGIVSILSFWGPAMFQT